MISYKIMETKGALEGTYARFVAGQTVSIDQIVDDIVRSTTLTRADVLATLAALSDSMAVHLKNGNRVHLRELGYFSPSIEGEIVTNKKGNKSLKNGYIRTIKFRPEQHLKGSLANLSFKQVVPTYGLSKHATDEDITKALRDLSRGGRSFTTKALAEKISLPVSSTYRLIKQLLKDGIILNVPSFQYEKLYTLK